MKIEQEKIEGEVRIVERGKRRGGKGRKAEDCGKGERRWKGSKDYRRGGKGGREKGLYKGRGEVKGRGEGKRLLSSHSNTPYRERERERVTLANYSLGGKQGHCNKFH